MLISALWFVGCATAGVNTHTLTVTGIPLGGAGTNITANAITRAFTNATGPLTILTNLTSTAHATTNIANAYSAFPQLGVTITWLTATQLVFRGTDLALSAAGGWYTLSTNASASTNFYAVMVPHFNLQGADAAAVRTNTANYLAEYLNYVDTNAIPGDATVTTNFVNTTAHTPTQHIRGPKLFHHLEATNRVIYGGTIDGSRPTNLTGLHGTVNGLTNGVYTSPILKDPSLTNGANYGNAFKSPGTETGSEQFGAGATAKDGGTALGNGATADTNGVALGRDAAAGKGAIALGETAQATHEGSVVIGNASSGNTNEILLGSSLHVTRIGGRLEGAIATNTFFKGTNQWLGDLAIPALAVSALADGTNILGSYTNRVIVLNGTLTADAYLAGIQGGRDGKRQRYRNNTGFGLTLLHNSGLAPVTSERFLCVGSSNAFVASGGFWDQHFSSSDGPSGRWVVEMVYPLGTVSGGSGEVNYNGEAGTTNATRVGLVAGKTGLTNLVYTLSEGAGITLTREGGTNVVVAATGSGGTVTSVDLAVPTSEFTVSGNPITGAGTITIAKDAQAANTAWMGPTSGGSAAPNFRTFVDADIPATFTTAKTFSAPIFSGFQFGVTNYAHHVVITNQLTVASTGTATFDGPFDFNNGGTFDNFATFNSSTIVSSGASLSVAAPATFSGNVTVTGLNTKFNRWGATIFTNATVTADNTAITTDRSFLCIKSDSATATSRTITLTDGSFPGQELRLQAIDTSNGWELVDGGNVKLEGNVTFTATQDANIRLYWDGSFWQEDDRRAP